MIGRLREWTEQRKENIWVSGTRSLPNCSPISGAKKHGTEKHLERSRWVLLHGVRSIEVMKPLREEGSSTELQLTGKFLILRDETLG